MKNISFDQISFRLKAALHIVAWLLGTHLLFDIVGLYFSLEELMWGNADVDEAFILIPWSIAFFYFNAAYLIPKFLNSPLWKQYLVFLLLSCLAFIGTGLLCFKLLHSLAWFPYFDWQDLFDNLLIFNLIILGISSSWGISKIAFQNMQLKKEAEKQQLKAELKLLKAQVNPHFLFNTLNTIYSLANEEEAPKTTDAVLKLSQMMRYMLKDAAQSKVPLQGEIDFLHSYISLQTLRLGDSIPIHFSIKGEAKDHLIAPLLLIPFIENAFKYGLSYQKPSPIFFDLNIGERKILFKTKNTIVKKQVPDSTGLGIKNVKQRLVLLYPNQHDLQIRQEDGFFKIDLEMEC